MNKLLDRLVIAAPCDVSWDSMEGDERVRHCSGCSKNVYNLSAMTKTEAEAFLQTNGVSECMRFYRRADGSILTENCPRGLRKLKEQYRKISGLAAALLSSFFSLATPSKAQNTQDYYNNPAGGGMIAQPAQPNTPTPTVHLLGKPAIRRPPTSTGPKTILVGPDCAIPPSPSKPLKPELQTIPAPRQLGVIESPKNGDTRAFDLWQTGRKNEAEGKFALAQTCYQEALKISQEQKNADPLFQKQIIESLNYLKEHYYKTPIDYPH